MMEMPSNTYSPIFTKLRAKVRTVPSSRAKPLLFSSRPTILPTAHLPTSQTTRAKASLPTRGTSSVPRTDTE